jgi:hypothetical protein
MWDARGSLRLTRDDASSVLLPGLGSLLSELIFFSLFWVEREDDPNLEKKKNSHVFFSPSLQQPRLNFPPPQNSNFAVTAEVVPSWSVVGTAGFSAGQAYYTSLAIDSTGTPYVAYQDGSNGDRATVELFS